MAQLAWHQHGKNRVRLGRVWREGKTHYMVEWSVAVMLESDMAHAFLTHSNKDMTATDTQKNTVYYVAKQCSSRCSPEEYAIALAKHFVDTYPKVSKAKVKVEAKPWQRITTATGEPHDHGFMLTGTEIRTTYVTYDEAGTTEVISGVKDMKVLKTTQSGYEGFLHDKYTVLKDTRERIVATSITSTWRYSSHVKDYDAAFAAVKAGIVAKFYGPAHTGVYSPSVQFTLMEMAKEIIATVPEVESIFFNLPNLHFLPCPVVASKFEDDVYIATSEPHGDIEAVVTRAQLQPHAKL
jgi:urate oxidase